MRIQRLITIAGTSSERSQFPFMTPPTSINHAPPAFSQDREAHLRPMSRGTPELCSWCGDSREQSSLPTHFCWTKMQAEAGQPLELIIRRKELERSAGAGFFYWGVGNSIGQSSSILAGNVMRPEVFFSVMRSKPKSCDVSPKSLLVWTGFVTARGEVEQLPRHVLILSRGDTSSGQKTRHYALLCFSTLPLTIDTRATVDASHLRNVSGTRGRLGHSQVTAVVEHVSGQEENARLYQVALRAELAPPYMLKLADPRPLRAADQRRMRHLLDTDPSPAAWRTFVENLRGPTV